MCRGLHAEQNALVQAARYGISLEDRSTAPASPVTCAKMLVNAGITKVIYRYPYLMAAQDLLNPTLLWRCSKSAKECTSAPD